MRCASPADDRETITIRQRLSGLVGVQGVGGCAGLGRGEMWFRPYLSNQCMHALKALNTMCVTSTTEVDDTRNGDNQCE